MNSKKLRCKRCLCAVGDATCLAGAADSSMGPCCIWHMEIDSVPDWIWSTIQQTVIQVEAESWVLCCFRPAERHRSVIRTVSRILQNLPSRPQAIWMSGKLNCFHCGAQLGSFSFLSRYHCPCGRDATVHFNRNCVDLDQTPRLLVLPSLRTGLELPQARQEEPALDPVCAGAAAGDTDAPLLDSSVTTPADVQAEPDGEVRSDDVDVESGATAGSALWSAESPGADEVCFTSDGGAEQQEETVSSSQDSVVLSPLAQIQMSKMDQNQLKRKQRRTERWLQNHLQEEEKEEPTCPARSLSCEDLNRDGLTCAVCLDVFFRPRSCLPCAHVFCEPCLRRLAWNRVTQTPCPLCRCLITDTSFHTELDHQAKTLFPRVWATRRQSFRNSPSVRFPLPSSQEGTHFLCCHGQRTEDMWQRWRMTERPSDLSAHVIPQLPVATLIVLFIISVALLLYLAGFFFTLFT